jgi:flavin-dependent dehydrogenase
VVGLPGSCRPDGISLPAVFGNRAQASASLRKKVADQFRLRTIPAMPENVQTDYDVIIIGGSLSGAAAATVLLREEPGLRVLIVEKSKAFTRRVGEATVEISAYFFGRILGLTQHLNESHLVKQGMRFWYYNDSTETLADSSEIGGRFQVRLPSYQLDRAVFDEEVLKRACALGAELRRPASVTDVSLHAGGAQSVTVKQGDQTETLRARWVIDASGIASLLARQEGWWRPNDAHPTTALWSRWRGVKDWDGIELGNKFPEWAAAPYTIRGTATNHVIGDGWWSWWIPLKGGDMSVGVVFDQRLVDWSQETGDGKLGDKLKAFLMRHPVGRELLAEAEYNEEDVHWRKNLPYYSTTFFGDGFALVGDAAAFLDPFYSPGMDWIAFTVSTAASLVAAQRKGEPLAPLVERHNRDFSRSYERWFTAIYRDKYQYMGDFDLFRIAFKLDLGLYYLGIVSQPFKRGPQALLDPPFASRGSVPVYHLIRTYNRRLAQIARSRRARGVHGAMNTGGRVMLNGFTFSADNVRAIAATLFRWGVLELREGWRTWFRDPVEPVAAPQSAPVADALP